MDIDNEKEFSQIIAESYFQGEKSNGMFDDQGLIRRQTGEPVELYYEIECRHIHEQRRRKVAEAMKVPFRFAKRLYGGMAVAQAVYMSSGYTRGGAGMAEELYPSAINNRPFSELEEYGGSSPKAASERRDSGTDTEPSGFSSQKWLKAGVMTVGVVAAVMLHTQEAVAEVNITSGLTHLFSSYP